MSWRCSPAPVLGSIRPSILIFHRHDQRTGDTGGEVLGTMARDAHMYQALDAPGTLKAEQISSDEVPGRTRHITLACALAQRRRHRSPARPGPNGGSYANQSPGSEQRRSQRTLTIRRQASAASDRTGALRFLRSESMPPKWGSRETPRPARAAARALFGATMRYAAPPPDERVVSVVGTDEVDLDRNDISWVLLLRARHEVGTRRPCCSSCRWH